MGRPAVGLGLGSYSSDPDTASVASCSQPATLGLYYWETVDTRMTRLKGSGSMSELTYSVSGTPSQGEVGVDILLLPLFVPNTFFPLGGTGG
jgi:hypothetical protein